MRITSGDDMLAAVAGCEAWRGRVVGALPDDVAPADAALWLRVITVDEAERLISGEIIAKGKAYTPSHGLAAIVAACCQVDVSDWTSETYSEDSIRQLFATPDAVLEFGDPAMPGSVAYRLLEAILEAGGCVMPDADTPAASPLALLDKVRGRGRWMPLATGEGHECYVSVTTERHIAHAQEYANVARVMGHEAVNYASWTRSILSHVLLKGPGEGPLLTMPQIGQLPYGIARAIEGVSANLSIAAGEPPTVKRFRGEQPVAAADGGAAGQDLVDSREATPAAV